MKDSDVIYYVKIGFLTACEFLVPSEPQAYHFPLHLCNFFPWIIYPCNFLNKFPFSALATIGFLSLGIYSSNSYLVKVLSMLKRHSGMSWRMISLSVQFSRSVAQSCPTLCDPMDCSTAGLPVHHQLPAITQIHVHWVGDAIQPSHPLSGPSPLAFNLSQHQGLFKWVSSLYQVPKVLEFQLQHQSFQWTFRTDFL